MEVLDGVEIMEQQEVLEDILVVEEEMDGIIFLGVLEDYKEAQAITLLGLAEEDQVKVAEEMEQYLMELS